MTAQFKWLNEPASHHGDVHHLSLTTGENTDFWQQTFYGFERDNGHAYLTPVSGDFSASATVRGDYRELYDQAGLMLRIDAQNWIKTGIEYTDGLMHFSVVVTNRISDWSVIPLHDARTEDDVHIRLTRHDNAVRVQFAINDAPWQLARLAPFSRADASVGIMACSPQRGGFEAQFRDLNVGPAIPRDLHVD
jgi:regulation of enolase protein 1 (concanavalin A-like superfamily)